MAKYRVTGVQLQKIFEDLEMKKLMEIDNYNYPSGSDTSNAPWNSKNDNEEGKLVKGNYEPVDFDRNEYLLKNKENNQLLFTTNDVWDELKNGRLLDIYDVLSDYLDIKQEEEEDENGRYMANASDWKDYITKDELLTALSSYMNDNRNILKIVDLDGWVNGEGKFLIVTNAAINEFSSKLLKIKAKELINLN